MYSGRETKSKSLYKQIESENFRWLWEIHKEITDDVYIKNVWIFNGNRINVGLLQSLRFH